MKQLSELQTVFKRYLFAGDKEISSHIVDSEGLGAEDRLAIYRNAYGSRLVEALVNDYSALNHLLGESEFREIGLAYAQAYPSRHYSLRWFGRNLVDFLREHETYRGLAHVVELAEFEWAMVNAFDAEDQNVATIEDAENIPPDCWPVLRLVLHPSIQRVTCTWNILSIWQAIKNKSEVPVARSMPDDVTYLIWRQALSTRYRSLAADEAVALDLAAKGADFAEICSSLMQFMRAEETALRAASLLKTWISEGLVTGLYY